MGAESNPPTRRSDTSNVATRTCVILAGCLCMTLCALIVVTGVLAAVFATPVAAGRSNETGTGGGGGALPLFASPTECASNGCAAGLFDAALGACVLVADNSRCAENADRCANGHYACDARTGTCSLSLEPIECPPRALECLAGACDDGQCVYTPDDSLCAGEGYVCAPTGTCVAAESTYQYYVQDPGELVQAQITTTREASCTGGAHRCVYNSGTHTVMCAGSNSHGQLGQPVTGVSDLSVPTFVAHAPLNGPAVVVQLACGLDFTCALLDSGIVYCWGSNAHLQQGRSVVPAGQEHMPHVIVAEGIPLNATAISAGHAHVCAIPRGASGGRLVCWGSNMHGELGVYWGTYAPSSVPMHVGGLFAPTSVAVVGVASGYFSTCATLLHYREEVPVYAVYCWGESAVNVHRLPSAPSHVPAAVPLDDVSVRTGYSPGFGFELIIGAYHACVRENDGPASSGKLACWGANTHGQLGTGVPVCVEWPCPVHPIVLFSTGAPQAPVLRASAGGLLTCLTRPSGLATCYGANTDSMGFGQTCAFHPPAENFQCIWRATPQPTTWINAGNTGVFTWTSTSCAATPCFEEQPWQ